MLKPLHSPNVTVCYKVHGFLEYLAGINLRVCGDTPPNLPLLKQRNHVFMCELCVHVFIRPWPVQPQHEVLPSNGSDLLKRRSIQSFHEHQPWTWCLSGKHALPFISRETFLLPRTLPFYITL